MKNKNAGWMAIFGIASVWFGTHVGSGFATGAQGLMFFAQYGWTALIFPALSMLICAGVNYVGMHGAIYNDLHMGRDWADWLYAPYKKAIGIIFDIVSLLCACLAVAACMAGTGSLLKALFGLPYMAGVIGISVVMLLLSIFGYKLVNSASGILSIAMIVFLLIIFSMGISGNSENLGNILSNFTVFEGQSVGGAFWKMLMYACFQATTVTALVCVNGSYTTSKDIRRACIIGFVMNALMLTLSCLTVLSGMPGTANELPILTVCQGLNAPWLAVVYQIALLLAFISTGVTCLFGLTERWYPAFKKPLAKVCGGEKTTLIKGIVALALVILNILIAQLGLLAIINKGYSYMGFISLIMYVIPSFTIGIIKIRRDRKRIEEDSIAAKGH